MYLFTRSRRVDPGEFMEAMEWTVNVTETVKRISGREVDAWTAFASPELGTIVWTMWVESMVDIETVADKLVAEPEYVKLLKKGNDYFEGPVTDGLASLIYGAPDPDAPRVNYVGVATATAANGRIGDAVTGAIAIADKATAITGQSTMVAIGATGPFGGIAWLTATPDLATMEAGEAALLADPTWLETIDQHGTAYAQDAAQSIYRRVG
jgi:hypothetical protein